MDRTVWDHRRGALQAPRKPYYTNTPLHHTYILYPFFFQHFTNFIRAVPVAYSYLPTYLPTYSKKRRPLLFIIFFYEREPEQLTIFFFCSSSKVVSPAGGIELILFRFTFTF